MRIYLDFEKPVADLQGKIQELRALGNEGDAVAINDEITRLEARAGQALADIYAKLTPWQKTQVARHPDRPHFVDYAGKLLDDFTPLAGDRKFAEDAAIIAGLGRFRGRSIALVGQEKGSDTDSRIKHNFGMARPEGYRKAVRLMELADRFGLPVLALVDTAGAYPGIGAEERGQAEAIAASLELMAGLGVPVIATVIGEGGSGGALALGVGNRILMLQHSIYSVISPESCSSILYRDPSKAEKMAEALKLTAPDLKGFGVIDEIVPEAQGGAHRDPARTAENLGRSLRRHLGELRGLDTQALIDDRYRRFRGMGVFERTTS